MKVPLLLGSALLVAAAILVAVSLRVRDTSTQADATTWTYMFFSAVGIAQMGIACFWWPLVKRREPPMKLIGALAIRALGILFLILVLGMIVMYCVMAVSWVLAPFLLVHLMASVYLMSKPRALLTWVSCSLGSAMVLILLFACAYPTNPGEAVAWALILGFPLLGLIVGSVLGLPVVWLWLRRAEKMQPLSTK